MVRDTPKSACRWTTSRPRTPTALAFAAALLVGFAVLTGLINGLAEGSLADTDAYSWANRVVDLRTDGRWTDETIDRIDPPTGHEQHWRRPFDVLLLAGGMVGGLFVDFTTALFAWAIVVPLLLAAVTVWLLWWGFADIVGQAGLEGQAVLIGAHPIIALGYAAGRADHETLTGVVMVAVVALVYRAIRPGASDRAAAVAGAISAVGLWVGMEFVLVIMAVMTVFVIEWVRGQTRAVRSLMGYTAALTVGSGLALVAENGWSGALHVELDELSIVFVVFSGLATAVSAVVTRLRTPTTAARRVAVLLTAAVGGAAALMALFPALLDGPLGGVDPCMPAHVSASSESSSP